MTTGLRACIIRDRIPRTDKSVAFCVRLSFESMRIHTENTKSNLFISVIALVVGETELDLLVEVEAVC